MLSLAQLSPSMLYCKKDFMKNFVHHIWVCIYLDVKFESKNQICKFIKNQINWEFDHILPDFLDHILYIIWKLGFALSYNIWAWLARKKIFVKKFTIWREKCKILEENSLKLIFPTEIQRNYWKNWIICIILQIGRFYKLWEMS